MRIKTVNKSAYALEIGERTPVHHIGKFKGVSIARTKKGYRPELPGFWGMTFLSLQAMEEYCKEKDEITRVRTRGDVDYM